MAGKKLSPKRKKIHGSFEFQDEAPPCVTIILEVIRHFGGWFFLCARVECGLLHNYYVEREKLQKNAYDGRRLATVRRGRCFTPMDLCNNPVECKDI